MKTTATRPAIRSQILASSIAALLASSALSHGATNTWNIGTGNWDTTTSNWLSGGGLWTNGDDAIFGGLSQWESAGGTATNETITITPSGVSAGSVTFNYTGINVAGAPSLTLTGAGGNITVSKVAQGPETTFGGGNSYVNTISAPIAGGVGLTKLGVGTLNLSAANIYTGPTTISAGTLRLSNATAIPGGIGAAGGTSALLINGGVLELANSDFLRGFGAAATQFQMTGGTSGFSSRDATRTVNIGGAAATVQWGSADFAPTTLVLNSFTANNQLSVSNGIDLNGAIRTIRSDSVGTSARATIAGVISDTGVGGGLTKTGTGLLELSAVTGNTYAGTTTVNGGILRLSSANALPGGIGATGGTSGLTLNGGVVEMASGNFLRNVGTGAAQFQITGGISGFSARTAIRDVTVNNDAAQELVWGSATFNPSTLLLNDVTADNQLNLNNKIDLNGATRTIAVNSTNSFANLTGVVRDSSVGGTGGLVKVGPGILRISTPVTYTGLTNIKGGTLELGASNIFPNSAPLRLGVNDAENSSLGGGTFASTRANSSAGNGASPGAGWARFDMRGFSDTVGTVTVDGMSSFLIGGGGTLTSNGSFEIKSGQILAALAGTGINLNKTGGGLALLAPQTGSSGANTPMSNTYTGTTTISQGVLRIFNINAIPGGIATLGGLSALTINGGVLEMGHDNTNAVVDFTRGLGSGPAQVQITGGRSGFSAWNANRAVNIGGAGATVTWGSTFFNPSILVLNESSAGRGTNALTFANSIDLATSAGARTIEVMSNGVSTQAATITGQITDSGPGLGLNKSGVGILILTANNNYNGVTTVKSGGVLNIQNNNALGTIGASDGTTVEAGAALQIQAGLTDVQEELVLNGTGIVNNTFQMLLNTTGVSTGMYQPSTLGATGGNTGALRSISGNNTINATVTLASAARIQSDLSSGTLKLALGVTGTNQDLTVGGSGNTTIGNLSLQPGLTTGTGKLTMHGQTAGSTAGVLTLNGDSTYTGKTTVRLGTIRLAEDATLNGLTGTDLDFTGAGVFEWLNSSQNMGALTFSSGDGTVRSNSAPTTIAQTFASYTAPVAGRTATFVTTGTAGGIIGVHNLIALTGQATGFMGVRVFANSIFTVGTGDRYAFYDAGGWVRAYDAADANYLAAPAGLTIGASTVTDNVDLDSGNITAQTTVSANTINMRNSNIAMTGTDQVLSTDGVISSGNVTTPTLGGGTTARLQPTTSGGELVIRVNDEAPADGTIHKLTVSSIIQNNTTASSLTKSGAGNLTISTAPTYTGKTTVAGGILAFTASTLGTIPSTEIVADSGELQLPASDYFVGNNVLAGGTSGNKITIQNGGRLATGQRFYMGYGVNADSNTITVDGIGSQLTNTTGNAFLWLGFSGDHNKIVVSNGGYYGANGGNAGSRHFVGENMGADFNTIEVSGKGSLFETQGNNWLTIGTMGSNNGVALSAGGMMWTGSMSIGGAAVGVVGGSSNTVTIADAGSILLTRKTLSIGRGVDAASNGITVSNGGMLYSQAQNNTAEAMHVFELGVSTGADNNFITVTGAGSRWMADYGWDSNGNQGNVTNTQVGLQTGVIGYAATASGNHVDVLNGGLWAMNVRLEMGGVNSVVNVGNGIGATALTNFRDIVMNTASARVKVNNGAIRFSSDAASISGLGQVQLDGAAIVSTELVAGLPTNNSIDVVITGGAPGTLNKTGAGTLTLSGANTFTGAITVSAGTLAFGQTVTNTYSAIDGAGAVSQTGTGTTILGSANTYLGVTTVSAGVLRLNHATALPGGIATAGGTNNLILNGGVVGLGAGNFTRGLGAGATEVQFTGSGGFAAYGVDRAVDLGGAAAGVVWGSGSFVPDGSTLILSASTADAMVTVANGIDLGTAGRTVQVDNGTGLTDDAKLAGAITGTFVTNIGDSGGLTKTGAGSLRLDGNQSYKFLTANAGTTNVNGPLTTLDAVVAVNNAGTKLRFGSVSQTLGSLTIGAGATVVFTSGAASGSFSGGSGKGASFGGAAVVPEPGTFGLLLVGALGILNRRRRQAE
jgi:fibronectin-binding autotransporter adhesin